MTVQGLPAGQFGSYYPNTQQAIRTRAALVRGNPVVTLQSPVQAQNQNQTQSMRPERMAPLPLNRQFAVLSYSSNATPDLMFRVARVDEFV